MLRDRLEYSEFLPEEFVLFEPYANESKSKRQLMEILLRGVPWLHPEHFVHFRKDEEVV